MPPKQPSIPGESRRPSRLLGAGRRAVGAIAAKAGDVILESGPQVEILDMNLAESYGVDWDLDKCGRDCWQNFFDENGGTVDGVRSEFVRRDDDNGTQQVVTIHGDGDYDYRYLTVLGATSKETGGQTAGGFGEGAKVLALSLMRDHGAAGVEYRSRDWKLEFFIDDMPEEKVAVPTRGLYARVTTGLRKIKGSTTTITADSARTADAIIDAKRFFRSSENPDFKESLLQKTLPDGTETGVRFMGVNKTKYSEDLEKGRLYVAGQMRHYSRRGDREKQWDTVAGISVWTTKDVAAGDRDRGALSKQTIEQEIFDPLVAALDETDVRTFFDAVEVAYPQSLGGTLSEFGALASRIAGRGGELGVKIEFDPKYVSVKPFEKEYIRNALKSAGYVMCPTYFQEVGMKSSVEVMATLREHGRIEATPEQQARVGLLQNAVGLLGQNTSLKKTYQNKPIWLFSKTDEKSPIEGSYDEEFVWMSEEHLEKSFPEVLATYLHELDHKYGSDQSAEFSYALTDTLAEIVHAMIEDPEFALAVQSFDAQWKAIDKKFGHDTQSPDQKEG